jgi:hypothetical protein
MKLKPASTHPPTRELARHHPAKREDGFAGSLDLVGDELLIEIRAAIHRLETDPEHRPFYHRDFRRVLTRRFSCKLCSSHTSKFFSF